MSERASVLVVDDDVEFARMVERLLASEGYRAAHAASSRAALDTLARGRFDIVLTDMKMPEGSGIELLRAVRDRHPSVEVVIMTGYGTIETTVEAMKLGAADFIPKPFENDELLLHLEQVAKVRSLEREVARLQGELQERWGFGNMIGSSAAMQPLFERIRAAAGTTSNVLISGESGTGKELAARAIHYGGVRAKGPFKAVNCAALPREIIESELFGHLKGAFTNALAEHEGLFRAAQGGTLFLDEIAEMPSETQAKLLRAIEEGKVRPVGSTSEVEVDCRIIAATNRDPQACVERGALRQDLFYRLSVIAIELPPLRARAEDIPLLVQGFVAQFNERFGKRLRGFEPAAIEALMKYAWPGNIRELRNVVEGLFALAKGPEIGLADLPARIAPRAAAGAKEAAAGALDDEGSVPPLEETLREIERRLILRALRLAKGNKSQAADLLRVSRKRIYRKLEEYGIPVDDALREDE
ncbi:MAG TPA: sigma-54 dependent transcriptional regulator [Planctomycetota bacterium]|nr:sigma-54 dependent transcriptional regulator [Planctomycetota bacterium]